MESNDSNTATSAAARTTATIAITMMRERCACERLVSTSAVLCVGNTLLLNGTVHSPPFVAVAIGADHDRFEADALVRRLHRDAEAFGLRFSVSSPGDAEVPAFDGAVNLRHAEPQS